MTETPAMAIRFKDVAPDEKVRERVERRCRELAEEFPEITHIEVTFEPEGDDFTAHGHAFAKGTEAATEARASELVPAADRLFVRLGKQLRRTHDKRIFARRREAMKESPKRG